jgi:aconitate hydratase
MAGEPYFITMPKIVKVHLKGKMPDWVSAKDIILKMLQMLTVKGGVGKIFEFTGDGISYLNVPERATITNMTAELGATTGIFPSDSITLKYLRAQNREKSFEELLPDKDSSYDETIEIDLSQLEPLIAYPHSPDNVKSVRELEGTKLSQVCIGSCTNSSYRDLAVSALILKGKKIHPDVSFTLTPGSKQVLEMITKDGLLVNFFSAGARMLESACGPCIGMGQAPPSGAISLRTFNRNFEGRSGTKDAFVYLTSPEVATVSAIDGYIKDPRKCGAPPKISIPEQFLTDDSMIIPPSAKSEQVEIVRGPNIKPLPSRQKLGEFLEGETLLNSGIIYQLTT